MARPKSAEALKKSEHKVCVQAVGRLADFIFGVVDKSASEVAALRIEIDALMPDLKACDFAGGPPKVEPAPIERVIINKCGDAAAARAAAKLPWGADNES